MMLWRLSFVRAAFALQRYTKRPHELSPYEQVLQQAAKQWYDLDRCALGETVAAMPTTASHLVPCQRTRLHGKTRQVCGFVLVCSRTASGGKCHFDALPIKATRCLVDGSNVKCHDSTCTEIRLNFHLMPFSRTCGITETQDSGYLVELQQRVGRQTSQRNLWKSNISKCSKVRSCHRQMIHSAPPCLHRQRSTHWSGAATPMTIVTVTR